MEDESGLVMKEFLEEFFEDSEEFSGVILKRFTTGSVATGEEKNKISALGGTISADSSISPDGSA